MILHGNEKVDGAVKSIWELEHWFNHRYGYPWVFDEVGFTGFSKQSVHSVTSRLIRLKACHSGDINLVVDGGEIFIYGYVTMGLCCLTVLMNALEIPRIATRTG